MIATATGRYGYPLRVALRAEALQLLNATGCYGCRPHARTRHTEEQSNHAHTLSRVHVCIPVASVAISVFKASARSDTLRVPVAHSGIES